MTIQRILPAIALLASLAAPAFAQAPATPPANPAARAEAERTLAALNMSATMEAVMATLRPQLVAQMRQAGQVDEARAGAAVDEVVLPAMRGAVPQMMAGIADIWARHYTVEDLRGLQAFYQSPIGRKSLQLQPVLARETVILQQTLLPGILQDAMTRNRDALRSRGINLN